MGGKDEMTKASSSLQDLRAEPIHQGEGGTNLAFLGTLRPRLQKGDALRSLPDGARKRRGTGNRRGHVRGHRGKRSGEFSGADPGRTGLQHVSAHGGTKVRVLSIPAIRDRVVQGALKLILEPIFEADFQSGSYGYRPKRTAHQA